MIKLVVIAAASAVACTSLGTAGHFNYISTDMPDREGVHVTYNNLSKHMLCLGPSEWPNAAGKMNHASSRVALIIEGQRYPIDDVNTGYCFGGCPTYVKPGEQINAFIPYKEFRLPSALRHKPKTLEFSPEAYRCKLPRGTT